MLLNASSLLKTALASLGDDSLRAAAPSRASNTIVWLRSVPAPILAAAAAVIAIAGLAVAGVLSRSDGGSGASQVATATSAAASGAQAADEILESDEQLQDDMGTMEMSDTQDASHDALADRAYEHDSLDMEMAADADAEMADSADTAAGTADSAGISGEAPDGRSPQGAENAVSDVGAATASTEAGGDDSAAPPAEAPADADTAIDLGELDSIAALWDQLDAFEESVPLTDASRSQPRQCVAVLHDFAASRGATVHWSFVATINAAQPMTVDAVLGEQADGDPFAAYAHGPGCTPVARGADGDPSVGSSE